MTACNRCGAPMVPFRDALIPALICTGEDCGRVIPQTGMRYGLSRAQVNRAMRAARRRRKGDGRATE